MIAATVRRYRAAFTGLPREVWVLALVLFVNRAGAMVLAFLTLYLTSQIALSEWAAGQMISLYGLGAIVGAFVGGRLVEAVGAIRLQTTCMFLAVPAYLALPLWSNPLAIGISILCLSLVNEAVRPANATAIAKLTKPADRTRAFALQRLAANLGFTFGPAVGGVLAAIDFRLLFVVDALTTLAAAVILLAYFRMRRLPGEVKSRDSSIPLSKPLADRQFVLFLVLALANLVVFFQLLSTYTLYLRDYYQLTKPQIGLMFAVNTLVIVVFEMVLIDYARRWSITRTIGWGCFLSCLGFGMLPFGSSLGFAIVAMLVLTVGEMLSLPLIVSYVANRAPAGSEGRYLGWNAVTVSLAFMLGPAIGATIYAAEPNAVWYASLAVGGLVLIGFYALPIPEHAATIDPAAIDYDASASNGTVNADAPPAVTAIARNPPVGGVVSKTGAK